MTAATSSAVSSREWDTKMARIVSLTGQSQLMGNTFSVASRIYTTTQWKGVPQEITPPVDGLKKFTVGVKIDDSTHSLDSILKNDVWIHTGDSKRGGDGGVPPPPPPPPPSTPIAPPPLASLPPHLPPPSLPSEYKNMNDVDDLVKDVLDGKFDYDGDGADAKSVPVQGKISAIGTKTTPQIDEAERNVFVGTSSNGPVLRSLLVIPGNGGSSNPKYINDRVYQEYLQSAREVCSYWSMLPSPSKSVNRVTDVSRDLITAYTKLKRISDMKESDRNAVLFSDTSDPVKVQSTNVDILSYLYNLYRVFNKPEKTKLNDDYPYTASYRIMKIAARISVLSKSILDRRELLDKKKGTWNDQAHELCMIYYEHVQLLKLLMYTTVPAFMLRLLRSTAIGYGYDFAEMILDNASSSQVVNAVVGYIADIKVRSQLRKSDTDYKYSTSVVTSVLHRHIISLLAAITIQDPFIRNMLLDAAEIDISQRSESYLANAWEFHSVAIDAFYNIAEQFPVCLGNSVDSAHYAVASFWLDTFSITDINTTYLLSVI